MSSSGDLPFNPKCVASTGDAFRRSVEACRKDARAILHPRRGDQRSNIFRKAQFSPDGTTVITHNEDHCLRSFVLPQDLLDGSEGPHALPPHDTFSSGSNIQSYAIYPYFDLQDPATTLVLSGSADVPVVLKNALRYEAAVASYPFKNLTTEEHRSARSLTFTPDGSHFLAGSENALAIFDISAIGSDHIVTHRMRPGRTVPLTGEWKMRKKGIISALSISSSRVLAAGSTEREVALYSDDGHGQCASVFSLEGQTGSGVSDLKWSPCGKYLLAAERQSNVIQVYDLRETQQKVATLTGRRANTPQILDIGVVSTANGFEVWAGGTDGCVRMWSNPGSNSGEHEPDAEMKMHEAPVSSVIWHPSGAVMASCSGERFVEPEQDEDSDEDSGDRDDKSEARLKSDHHMPDNTLNVWTI